MKLAFSTLGCPDWSFNEIFSTAVDLKINGIEIRGIENEIYVPAIKAFSLENIEKTKAKLNSQNIVISMLTSGAVIGVNEKSESAIIELKEYIDLAEKLNCKFIRVMISSKPSPTDVDLKLAENNYNLLCNYGKSKNVIPLIETNGVLAESTVMKKFMLNIESENKGVLWDVHHPFRFFNESAKNTFENLSPYIKYVHIKDSVVDENDKISYRMLGYGDVPVFDSIKLLKDNNYDSFISLEWVKRWIKDLQVPGIVFAHFANYMEQIQKNI